MRVAIERSVADDPQSHRYLTSILILVEQGWHLWEIDDPEGLEASEWLRDSGSTGLQASELFKKSVVRSAYPTKLHRRTVRVTARPEGDLQFAPSHAMQFLQQPLNLLVENRESDGAFVDAVVDTLGGEELRGHWRLDPLPVRKDSRGGTGEMRRHVTRRPKEPVPARLFVLSDGGGEGPGQKTDDAASLERLCRDEGVPCWILQKYEIENYLPESLLAESVGSSEERERLFFALKRLSADQKDFFDVKEGMVGLRRGRKSGRADLFQDLPEPDVRDLERGFGGRVAGLWTKRPIDPDDLRKRAGSELEELLDLLCESL